jgi:glycosyltransferase involved in cell wall biosynthesis
MRDGCYDEGGMAVSLITTERNEVRAIAEFLDSALRQSLPPDEIVIADGGSTDGTVEIIQQYVEQGAPIRLLSVPGNRSVGRNAATEAARNEIVACTDVGNRLDEDWLRVITEPLRADPAAMVVSGGFRAEPHTWFETVSATLMLAPNDTIDLGTWLPSSRSIAYRKGAWRSVGGYPEHTNFNEDTPFAMALREAGYRFEDGLRAIVYWRPRSTLREFYRQYHFYAVGDGLDRLHGRQYAAFFAKYAGLVGGTVALALVWPPGVAAWIALFAAHTVARVLRPWRKLGGARALGMMVVLKLVYETSQLTGYATGVLRGRGLRGSEKLVR